MGLGWVWPHEIVHIEHGQFFAYPPPLNKTCRRCRSRSGAMPCDVLSNRSPVRTPELHDQPRRGRKSVTHPGDGGHTCFRETHVLEQDGLPRPSSLPRCSRFSDPLKYQFVRQFASPVYSFVGNILYEKQNKTKAVERK